MRHSIVATCAVLLLGMNGCSQDPISAPERIFLITIDTLRADHVQFLGYPAETTPFLSQLAERSAVFANAYSAASHTTPAHASILTSLYPDQHGALENGQGLAPDVETMAGLLRKSGYRTAAFTSVGFLTGLEKGFDTFKAHERGASIYSQAHLTMKKAKRWLAKQDPTDPLFVWIHLFDVHEWNKSKPEDRKWLKDQDVPSDLARSDRREFLTEQHGLSPGFLESDEELHHVMDNYDRRIRYVDSQIDYFFNQVEELGLQDNSVWIVTADHGEGLYSHGYNGHGRYLFDEQLHVPLLIYSANGLGAGARIDDLVRHIDLLPTIAELTGLPLRSTAGESLLPMLRGDSNSDTTRTSFAKRRPATEQQLSWNWSPGSLETVYDLKFKYIFSTSEQDQFYDLAKDPLEQHNMIEQPSKDLARLKKALAAYRRVFSRKRVKGSAVSEETKEELRSLGYIE